MGNLWLTAGERRGLAKRQVELLAAGVDPHVPRAHHAVGVAGKAQTFDEKGGGDFVVVHPQIDMIELDKRPGIGRGVLGKGGIAHRCFSEKMARILKGHGDLQGIVTPFLGGQKGFLNILDGEFVADQR